MSTNDKRIVLVTGGNAGIGYAIVEALLKSTDSGPYTVLFTSRSQERAASAIKSLEAIKQGDNQVKGFECDIEDPNSRQRLFENISKEFGKIDVLINNAGASYDILAQQGKLTPLEAWNKSLNLNVTSTHFFTELFVPLLLKGDNSKIIFISSNVASLTNHTRKALGPLDEPPPAGWPKQATFHIPAYRSSKAAHNMMAREWHKVLFNDHVKVYILSMGRYATDFGGTKGDGSAEQKKEMGVPEPSVAGEWVKEFVEDGKHQGEEGKFMAIEGEMDW